MAGSLTTLSDVQKALRSDPTCLDCVRKHLAAAMVNENERRLGYPHYLWLVVGNLHEAERESVVRHPALAAKIRAERIKYMADQEHLIPFFTLIDEATRLAGR